MPDLKWSMDKLSHIKQSKFIPGEKIPGSLSSLKILSSIKGLGGFFLHTMIPWDSRVKLHTIDFPTH